MRSCKFVGDAIGNPFRDPWGRDGDCNGRWRPHVAEFALETSSRPYMTWLRPSQVAGKCVSVRGHFGGAASSRSRPAI